MTTVIGDISAVLGILQFGFSLATANHAFVGDYKDAPDGIEALGRDINAVVLETQAIENLVEQNGAVESLDKADFSVTKKCLEDLKRCLEELSKLLAKVGVTTDLSHDIAPEKVEVSRAMKFYWPRIKPQVEEVQRRLDRARIQILLARSSIEYRVGSTPERRKAHLRIPGLTRHLDRLVKAEERLRLVQHGHEKSDNPRSKGASSKIPNQKRLEHAGIDGEIATREQKGRVQLMDEAVADRSTASYASGAKALEIFRDRIRQEIQFENSTKDIEAARMKKLQQDAVAAYQQQVRERVQVSHDHATATRDRLLEIFGPENTKGVEEYVKEQQERDMQDEIEKMALASSGQHKHTPDDAKGLAASAKLQENTTIPEDGVGKARKRVRFLPRISFWKKRPHMATHQPTPVENGESASNTAVASGYYDSHKSSRSTASSTPSVTGTTQPNVRFAHLVLTYHTDFTQDDACVPFDGTELSHYPCYTMCNFGPSPSTWTQIPHGARFLAQSRAKAFFGDLYWELHATIPVDLKSRAQKARFQSFRLQPKLEPASRGNRVVLVVFSAVDNNKKTKDDRETGDGQFFREITDDRERIEPEVRSRDFPPTVIHRDRSSERAPQREIGRDQETGAIILREPRNTTSSHTARGRNADTDIVQRLSSNEMLPSTRDAAIIDWERSVNVNPADAYTSTHTELPDGGVVDRERQVAAPISSSLKVIEERVRERRTPIVRRREEEDVQLRRELKLLSMQMDAASDDDAQSDDDETRLNKALVLYTGGHAVEHLAAQHAEPTSLAGDSLASEAAPLLAKGVQETADEPTPRITRNLAPTVQDADGESSIMGGRRRSSTSVLDAEGPEGQDLESGTREVGGADSPVSSIGEREPDL